MGVRKESKKRYGVFIVQEGNISQKNKHFKTRTMLTAQKNK